MRILFAGDTHCDINFVEYLFYRAVKMEADRIFVLGDFGFWPRMKDGAGFLLAIEKLAEETGVDLYWLDGNHEDHEILNDVVDGERDQFVKFGNHTWYSPRGHVWEWDGIRFGTVGGAYSIDRDYRTLGVDWFHEELITDTDVEAALKHKDVQVMLTHDAPITVDMQMHLMGVGRRPYKMDWFSNQNRDYLETIRRAWTPSHLFHGHWHIFYRQWLEEDWVGTPYISMGLNCNQRPSKAWTLMDTETFNP